MSNLIIVVFVVYLGLCIGTYINLREYKIPTFTRFRFSLFAPISLHRILVSIAIDILRDKEVIESSRGKYFLCFCCFLMYADAVRALGEVLAQKSVCTHKKTYHVSAYYGIQVKQKISHALVAA